MRAHRWVPPALTVTVVVPLLVAAAPSGGAAVPRCDGEAATIVGTAGPDRLTGTRGRDVIVGLGGSDVIEGLGGPDVVCGGPGADRLVGGPGNDRLFGGRDRRATGAGGTYLVGDVLEGGPGADLLVGGADTRRADQRRRPDTYSFAGAGSGVTVDLSGEKGSARGQGHDTILTGPASRVVGTDHDDTVVGSAGPDTVDAGGGHDTVVTGAGADTVFPDGVRGDQPGRDTVDTGSGPDFVSSLAGRDTISTGLGADFVEAFSPAPTVVSAGGGRDYVGQYVTPGRRAGVDGGPGDDTVTFYGDLLGGQEPPAQLTVDTTRGTTSASGEVRARGTIAGVERHRFVGPLRWRFLGSEARERVWAISGGPLRAVVRGGDDVVTGSSRDDVIDGGPGQDTGYGGGGTDTCVDVERGDC